MAEMAEQESSAAECVSNPELDVLTAPIPGDEPAGDCSAYIRGLRDQFQELRREEHANDFDDATRPAVLKKSDWPRLIQLAEETLKQTTKDLRVACHLVEGWTQTDGFAGLARGLELIRSLVEQCWDRLVPPLEEDEQGDGRGELLGNMLDDPLRGIALPTTVRLIPLIGPDEHPYSLTEWSRLRADSSPEAQDEISRTLAKTGLEALQRYADEVAGCLASLDALVPVMDQKMGDSAPSLSNLRRSLEECQVLLGGEISEKSPSAPAAKSEETNAALAASDAASTAPEQAISSREQAYAQLERAASLLRQLEPHSPVPYMIQRAVQFGRLPFPRLMEQLIRDEGVLGELHRELGVEATAGADE